MSSKRLVAFGTLDEHEVDRLNEAARQFAAGIRFSTTTDNLAPLTPAPALVDPTNDDGISTASTSDDSIASLLSNKADFRSEALQLRVKVTTLEAENEELRVALALSQQQPSAETMQQHLNLIHDQYRQQFDAYQLELQRAHQKANEAAIALSQAHSRLVHNDRANSSFHELMSQRDEQLQLLTRDVAEKARQISGLEERIHQMSECHIQILANRDTCHRREIDEVVTRYSKMLTDMQRTHAQLQQQYAADVAAEGTVKLRFLGHPSSQAGASVPKSAVGQRKPPYRAGENVAEPTSDNSTFTMRTPVFNAHHVASSSTTAVVASPDRSRTRTGSAQPNDSAWDSVQLALSLAKVSHKKLAKAKRVAKQRAADAARKSAAADAARAADVKTIEGSVQNMLMSFQDCANKLQTMLKGALENQCKQMRLLQVLAVRVSKELQNYHDTHNKIGATFEDKFSAKMFQGMIESAAFQVTKLAQFGQHRAHKPGDPFSAQELMEQMRDCSQSFHVFLVNYDAVKGFELNYRCLLNELVASALAGTGIEKKQVDNSSISGILEVERVLVVQKGELEVLRKDFETVCKNHSRTNRNRTEAITQLEALAAGMKIKEALLSAANERADTRSAEVAAQAAEISALHEINTENDATLARLEQQKEEAVAAERSAAEALVTEFESNVSAVSAREADLLSKERNAANEAIAEANAQIAHLSEEGAAAAMRARCLDEELKTALRNAKSVKMSHRSKVLELEKAKLAAIDEHCDANARMKGLEVAHQQLQHDWCSSEAAVANLEAAQVALEHRLEQEKAARSAAYRAALSEATTQLGLRQHHEENMAAAEEMHVQRQEAALHTQKQEAEEALRAAVAAAAQESAKLRMEVAAAQAAAQAAQSRADTDQRNANATIEAVEAKIHAATTFRDGEIRALQETLARNDLAQMAVCTGLWLLLLAPLHVTTFKHFRLLLSGLQATSAVRRELQAAEAETTAAHEAEIARLEKKVALQKHALVNAKTMVRQVQAEMQRLHKQRLGMGVERWTNSSPGLPQKHQRAQETHYRSSMRKNVQQKTAQQHSRSLPPSKSSGAMRSPESFQWTTTLPEEEPEELPSPRLGKPKSPTRSRRPADVDEKSRDRDHSLSEQLRYSIMTGTGSGLVHDDSVLTAMFADQVDDELVGVSFYGSGISLGMQSGDELTPPPEQESRTMIEEGDSNGSSGSHSVDTNGQPANSTIYVGFDSSNSSTRSSMADVSRILGHVGSQVGPSLFDAEPWVDGSIE